MIQRRMTVARIPPVITTVPAVIRPMPHPPLRRDAQRGEGQQRLPHRTQGRNPSRNFPHSWRQGGSRGWRGLGGLTRGLIASGGQRGGRALTEGVMLLPLSTPFQRFLLFFFLNSLLPLFSPLLTSCLNNHPPCQGSKTQRKTASLY